MVATMCTKVKRYYDKLIHTHNLYGHTPESYGQWQDVDKCIDLEDTEEENSKMFKCFGEEVPE